MSDFDGYESDESDSVDAAIAAWMEAGERGQPLDRTAFLQRHASIAEELRTFLDDYRRFQAVVVPGGDPPP